jgi:putative ABC transport system substrate-binding protein
MLRPITQPSIHHADSFVRFCPLEIAEAGGLLAYGVDQDEMFVRAAVFVAKILKGAKPAELPVEQPTRFKFVINLKTAKALGLTIPYMLSGRADEVIE